VEPYPLRLLPHVVRLHVLTGYSQDGTPTYAAGTPYHARVVYRDRSIMTRTGQLVHERGFVLVAGPQGDHEGAPPAIKTDDQLVLPDGDVPPLMEAAQVIDGEGNVHHARVSFG
jgi:hypothetical protein